ncbi:hypothetical protein BOSEA31B_12960 [Hyphomicrobiales bacterium]|nr:hypothetical protein BOSEA31B_12960 [Hyphomicrobiales bacterium]
MADRGPPHGLWQRHVQRSRANEGSHGDTRAISHLLDRLGFLIVEPCRQRFLALAGFAAACHGGLLSRIQGRGFPGRVQRHKWCPARWSMGGSGRER